MPLDYAIAEATLPNGLRVIVAEDHSVPTVAVNLWVGVGSRHEPPGKTGFAHLFEHLMFQGSANVASGEHFSLLMGQGGRLNATTWFDRTNYFETIPSGALDLALWLEADRHARLLPAVTQDNFDNQRDVVKEEKRQRYDNVPYGQALNLLYSLVYPEGHPYHHPTIGSMADLDAATLEDVHAFFRTHYHPANTVLTLAGDVTVDAGRAAAERYFGAIPPRPGAPCAPGPVGEALGPLTGVPRLELHQDLPADRLYLGFRLPVDNTAGYLAGSYALDVLGGLTWSRLERQLVRREEIALSASAFALGLIDGASLGVLAFEIPEGVEPAAVEERVCEILAEFAAEGPTEHEMEATFAQTERAWLSSLASLEERADHLSRAACLFGEPQQINTFLDEVAAVTPDEVRRAAAGWLTPDNRAVLAYIADETSAS